MSNACEACGAWWLPGAEQCPAHRPGAKPHVEERDGRTVLVQEMGAPRVYPKSDPWIGVFRVHPLQWTGPR